MALTDKALRALKPKEKAYIVSDGQGLYMEVLPTGGMAWRYRYSLNGKTEKLSLGKYPALSLRQARLKRDEAAALVARGQSPARQKQLGKRAGPETTTVAQFAHKYFLEVVAKERKDDRTLRRYLEKEILPAIGSKPIRAVTTEDVRRIIWQKKDQGFDAAAAALRGLLKRLFDYALTCGLCQINPTQGLPMRHIFKPKARERVLSPEEIRIFLKAVFETNLRRQFKLSLYLLLLTLARKSELRLARWETVYWDKAEWHVPAEQSKTGKPHIVYLSRQAVELLRELHALAGGSELVLPGQSSLARPFAANALNRALQRALQCQPIPHFTVHDLRRTAATLLHENGWSSDIVEKALNHSLGGVRGVYNRAAYATQRREMLQFWADFVEGLMVDRPVMMGRFGRTG